MPQSKTPSVSGENIQVKSSDEPGCRITSIKITPEVEVGTRDGWLCLWTAGREVCIGPLTPEQAEKLSDDLAYEMIQG